MIDGFRAPRVVRPMTFYVKLRCVEDPLVIHFSEHCERRTASLRITYKPILSLCRVGRKNQLPGRSVATVFAGGYRSPFRGPLVSVHFWPFARIKWL